MSYNVSVVVSHRFLVTYLDVFKRRNLVTMAVRSTPTASGIQYLVRSEDHADFLEYICSEDDGNT